MPGPPDTCGTVVTKPIVYQWLSDGTPIDGAHGQFSAYSGATATYRTKPADEGHLITAEVTACANTSECTVVPAIGSFIPTDGTPPGNTDARVGVNTVCNPAALAYDELAAPSWVRIFVQWRYYERTQGHFSAYPMYHGGPTLQACIEALHRAGDQVLVDFSGTPCWATAKCWSPPNGLAWTLAQKEANDPTYNLDPPDDPATYASAATNLVTTLASTCGGPHSPYPLFCGIQAVEVWNEENASTYWSGSLSQYEHLLQGAYTAISAATGSHDVPPATDAHGDPLTVKVVLDGTFTIDHAWDNALLDDENDATTGTQCPHGPQGKYCFDILGVHAYLPSGSAYALVPGTNTPDIPKILNGRDSNNTLTNLARDLTSHGLGPSGSDIPIWITEMGSLAGSTLHRHWMTDAQNANMLANFYRYIRKQPVPGACAVRSPGCSQIGAKTFTCPASTCDRVKAGMWFTDNLPATSGGIDFDLLDPPGETTLYPKPEYAAFVNLP
jgi:hypothetical protein